MVLDDIPILVVRDASGEVLRRPFDLPTIVAGRSDDVGLLLEHATVSKRHAEFFRNEKGECFVKDLGSRNGTLIRGKPISEYRLTRGDEVAIGPFVVTLIHRVVKTTAEFPAAKSSSVHATRVVVGEVDQGNISTLRDHKSPQIDVAHLTALNAFSHKLLGTAKAAERARLLCKLMVGPQFRGKWGVIVRMNCASPDEPVELLYEAYAGNSDREPYLSRGVLRRVRDSGDAVLASNAGLPAPTEFDVKVSISPQVVQMAAVACPVSSTASSIDVLYVVLPPSLGGVEWLALVNLAVKQYQQAEAALTSRRQAAELAVMERELTQARQIQMRLVPSQPQFPGLDVAIGFLPCHWVAGDYVDAVTLPDGRIFLTLADVCGKGLPAAMVARSVHTMIHAGVLRESSLVQLVTNLNLYLIETLTDDSFVTMIAIAITPLTGEVEMVNMGHPPMLIVAPTEKARQVDMEGNLPLGLERGPITSARFTLGPLELAALYSDGLTELSRGESGMLGIGGLSTELSTLYSNADASANTVADQLASRLNDLQGSQEPTDDRTFLLARRSAPRPTA